MGNKNNFIQAMREMLDIEAPNDKESASNGDSEEKYEAFVENIEQEERLDMFGIKKEVLKQENSTAQEIGDDITKTPFREESARAFNENIGSEEKKDEEQLKEVETTLITKNTVIEGNIKSFEHIELEGRVNGTIQTQKNVGVRGFVQGDIAAEDVVLRGAQVRGNIDSKGSLVMDKDTMLVGNIEAKRTRVDGKVKGELKIDGDAELLSNSVVIGNINASNFYVQYGAKIQGYIDTNFSKNEEDSLFETIVSGN